MDKIMEIECSIDFKSVMNGVYGELTIGEDIYILDRLNQNMRGNKGGNSWVMKMFPQNSDPQNDSPVKIIKINKWNYYDENNNPIRRNNKRINKEIEALNKCKINSANYVIRIDTDGVLINSPQDGTPRTTHRFYTMEVAECDLKQYMENYGANLDYNGKLSICLELTKALDELYKYGFYHRDIKPDNFFYVENEGWKVGDLGLVKNRKSEVIIDGENEFVGPRGWTSPETMNKYLVKESDNRYDRLIDEKSDMFQLGMVFWYIMQGNAPIGNIMEKDFKYQDHSLYILIRTMVSYDKTYRPKDFNTILERLNYLANREIV